MNPILVLFMAVGALFVYCAYKNITPWSFLSSLMSGLYGKKKG